jgi:hypothetical protein
MNIYLSVFTKSNSFRSYSRQDAEMENSGHFQAPSRHMRPVHVGDETVSFAVWNPVKTVKLAASHSTETAVNLKNIQATKYVPNASFAQQSWRFRLLPFHYLENCNI